MKNIFIIGIISILFASCKPEVAYVTVPTAGNADFSEYLAIGNSLTAGFADNSLTVSGQLNSYPQRLFEQFSLVPGRGGAKGNFVQPLLQSNNGFPNAKFVVAYYKTACNDTDSTLTAIPLPNFIMNPIDSMPYTWLNSTYNNGQVNNIGVPGIRVADYPVVGYATGNVYAKRFYHAPIAAFSPLQELKYRVNNLHPTFFTIWLGANDVLGYAAAGGVGVGNGTAVPNAGGLYNAGDITPNSVFYNYYDSIVATSVSTGASGALINIPDITALPFFNVIPSNGLVITEQRVADSLNDYWKTTSIAFKAFHVGNNQFMVQDHNNGVKQSVPGELILMSVPADSLSCKSWGAFKPIPNKYVLTTEELQFIRTSSNNFNSWIYQESLLYKLAIVDMKAYMNTLTSGIVFNGNTFSPSYLSGGAFSLDGIHLTQRGYALVANNILTEINAYYHATIPMIDVNKYNGIVFP
jgi:GDSL-like Lipase/Acylhydrolase